MLLGGHRVEVPRWGWAACVCPGAVDMVIAFPSILLDKHSLGMWDGV
jgi:hypothetical protein